MLALDRHGRLRPVALQEPEAETLLAGMPHAQRMASWHLVGEDGRVFSGGDAFPPLLRLIPGAGPLAWALAAVPPLTDAGYRAVAGRRSLLGRLIPSSSAASARKRIEARRGAAESTTATRGAR